MFRLLLLPWVALVVGVFSLQCAELSKDCRNTLTCDEAPTLGADCIWRYPDGSVWQGGPRRTPEDLWEWPNGRLTRTQNLTCPQGDAGVDGGLGPIFLGDCPRVACDAPLLCDPPSGLCVECLDNTACANAVSTSGERQPVCDPRSHACVACRSDTDCGNGRHCKIDVDPRRNACVECVGRSHCSNGEVCDSSSNQCTSTCTGPGQCDDPDKPICSNLATGAGTGVCVECLDSSVCSGNTPQCNTVRKQCVECVDDSVCGGRVCNGNNRCVECVDDTRCGGDTPNCDPDSNTCVACLNNSQCTAPTASKCNAATHQCEPCTDDIQCEGALPVCSGGRCVACKDNSTCTDPAAPHCDTGTGTCVSCGSDAQCTNPALPRCDTSTHTCVGCTSPAQCAGKFGPKDLCRVSDGACVQCEANADCAGDAAASRCDSAAGLCSRCQIDGDCNAIAGLSACSGGANARCVECTTDAFCAGNLNGRACNTTTNTCVECVTDAHCTSPGASRCVNNTCQPCVTDAGGSHCSHIVTGGVERPVCDVSAGPTAGVCVQCTGAQRAACGTFACDSLDRVCSPFQAGSANFCGDCVSDAHCPTGWRCVQEQFEGSPLSAYSCFPVASGGDCPQTPFSGLTTLNTIDGVSEAMCLLRRSTCAGYNQAGNRSCTGDADCGEEGLDDGRCEPSDNTCSLPCTSGIDCPSGENDSCLGGVCLR
jgi:hypothetical protein